MGRPITATTTHATACNAAQSLQCPKNTVCSANALTGSVSCLDENEISNILTIFGWILLGVFGSALLVFACGSCLRAYRRRGELQMQQIKEQAIPQGEAEGEDQEQKQVQLS